MDRLSKIILAGILILAFGVRFFGIAKSPPSLNWDEAALGYNAYSILKTGRDEFGKKLPLSLRSFDDYKPAVYSYVAVPFIKAFGLNEISVRLPSVIAGTVIVLLAYLFAKEFFKKEQAALISSFLVAAEPWSVHFSRVAFESNLALMFFLTGIYLFLKSRKYILPGFFLILSALTYHSEKILVFPLAVLSFIFDPGSLSRFASSSIFSHYPASLDLIKALITRYFSYFSPVNLFVRGTPEPTQHIPNFGMFYPLEFLLLVVGLYFLIQNFRKHKILFFLLVVSPVPAIATWNWFYPARVLPLFFFLSLIIAYGLYRILNKYTAVPVLVILISGVLNLLTSLYFFLPYQERGNWQYGMREMAQALTKYQDSHQRVVIETKTAQPYIFLLFYTQYDPQKYQEYSKDILSPRNSFNFDKYEFRDIYWDKDKDLKNTLFIGPESSLPVTPVYEVKDFEGNVLYRVAETK
ncbi:MAG: hypothetical protein UX13_C0021G0006 [Candidatus Woesebacteria bacterium GW2011_GWB1_45_5]|uniref:ArnT-like N-terminal domain-containing protein n=1 Tax=Candidatus Woesebacteria bacterium GW2011_GWB1_45_5 TaxID=1618581 RepID=A0A0G1MP00_9BACT|nr:MAG: hypothetical protein UX13_C0021G0006 [Candidatus Woesebacteria bacterium GW2011_GWB1_45_5]